MLRDGLMEEQSINVSEGGGLGPWRLLEVVISSLITFSTDLQSGNMVMMTFDDARSSLPSTSEEEEGSCCFCGVVSISKSFKEETGFAPAISALLNASSLISNAVMESITSCCCCFEEGSFL